MEVALSGKASNDDLKALETALTAQLATINADLEKIDEKLNERFGSDQDEESEEDNEDEDE